MTKVKKAKKKSNQTRGKSWTGYLVEFFMLFFAVSLGFFAENIREKRSDNVKEKEYINSMIEDAETDKVNIEKAIASNNIRVLRLDSLANLCVNYDPSFDSKIYRLYYHALIHPDFVTPTERTMRQLKNAGGMRLIRNSSSVDNIILYDSYSDKLLNQQKFCERYQNNAIEAGFKLFNFQTFGFGPSSKKVKNIKNSNVEFQLVTSNKSKLMEFGNNIIVYAGIVNYYSIILSEMDQQADELIKTLKKEYGVN